MRMLTAMGIVCLFLAASAASAQTSPSQNGAREPEPAAAHPLMPPNPYFRPPDWMSLLDPEARRMWERILSFAKLKVKEDRRWLWVLTLGFESFDNGPTAAQEERLLWLMAGLGYRQAQRDIDYLNRAYLVGSLEARWKSGPTLRLSVGPPTNGIWYGGLRLILPFK